MTMELAVVVIAAQVMILNVLHTIRESTRTALAASPTSSEIRRWW
jgi:hypothetical protein